MKKISVFLFAVGLFVLLAPVCGVTIARAQMAGDPKGFLTMPEGSKMALLYLRHVSADTYSSNHNQTFNNDYDYNYGLFRAVYWGKLAGMTSQYNLIVPFGRKVQERPLGATRYKSSGLGDLSLRAYLWFIEQPKIKTAIGWNITAPTGEYHNENGGVNMGANKWGYGPELGIAYTPIDKWLLEVHETLTWSTNNNDYGTSHQKLATDALFNTTVHLTYTINKNFYLAASYYWLRGGENQLEGVRRNNDIATQGMFLTGQVKFDFPFQILLQYGKDLSVKNGFETTVLQTRLCYFF